MTICEAWETKKAAQAAAGQAAARSGETVAPPCQQSVGGIQVPLAAIFAALAALGKKTAEKLRQKRKENDGRSQTAKSVTILAGGSGGRLGLAPQPKEAHEKAGASQLISKKSLHSFWESAFFVFAMRNKFRFSGIAAVVTAVRQWIFGKSKAGADDGGGFGIAAEPEEKEKPAVPESPFSSSSPPLPPSPSGLTMDMTGAMWGEMKIALSTERFAFRLLLMKVLRSGDRTIWS